MRQRPPRVRWQSASSVSLAMLEPGSPPVDDAGTTPGASTSPTRTPRYIVVLCVLISAFGILMMLLSGANMLDGDFTSTGSGRRGWVTPPIAFLLGLGLALSPIGIARQERGFGRLGTIGDWYSTLVLHHEFVYVHGVGRAADWTLLTSERMSQVPEAGRRVVQYYLDHPEHRVELGTEAGVRRAVALTRGG